MKILILITLLFQIRTLVAQENPFLTPIGSDEAILGNTGIAIDESVGSVIYNPAGLASIKISKISGSASAFSFNSVRSKGPGYDDTTTNVEATPSQITSVFTKKDFNLAFSVLIPTSFTTNVKRTTLTDNIGEYVENIDITSKNSLFGPSIAYSYSSYWAFGASVFVIKNEHNEVSDTSFGLDNGTSKYLDVYRDTNKALAIFPIFGALYTPSSKFSWGFRLSAPSIQISGQHESTIKQYQNDGTNPEATKTDKQVKHRKYENPVDLGTGVAYQISGNTKIYTDLSLQFKKNYVAYLYDAYGEDEIIDLKNTLRFNLGIERRTSRTDAITLGLNYNPDPRNIPNPLNFFGITAGYKSLEKLSDTRVGLFYNQASAESYKSKTTYKILGLILSTSINFRNL
jgi:hypothetical protein